MAIELALTSTDLVITRGNFTDAILNVAVTLYDTYTTVRSYASGTLPIARYAWTADSDTTTTTTTTWSTESMTATGDDGALTSTLEVPGAGNSSRSVSLVVYGITGGLSTITVTNSADTVKAEYDATAAYLSDPYTDDYGKKWYLQGSGWQYRQRAGTVFPSKLLGRNVLSSDVLTPISEIGAVAG